jgi:hypothetical protein
MTLDINYTTTNPRNVDKILESAVETAMIAQGNVTLAYPYNSEGIQAAVDRIVATGKPGTVVYAAEAYSVTQSLTLVDGVSHLGVFVKLNFSGDIPDVDWTPSGGTVINIAAGVEFMVYNHTDLATQVVGIGEASLTGVQIKNLAFVGGKGAIKIGAYRNMGPTYCKFSDLYFLNQTDYHFHVENFQHCEFNNFHGKNQLTSTGGFHYYTSVEDPAGSTGLLPGNSHWTGEHYSWSSSRLAKNYVFFARGVQDCQMNELAINARMQANRYGDVATSYTLTSTGGGSPNFILGNPADITKFPVGMPLVFTSGTPQFLAANSVYYVNSNNGVDTITLKYNPEVNAGYAGVSITNAASFTARMSGFPAVIFHATPGSLINNSDLGNNWDVEANGNVCAISMYRVRDSSLGLHEVMPSDTSTAIALRDCTAAINCRNMTNITTDFDDTLANTKSIVNNMRAGNRYLTAGTTLTTEHHQCKLFVLNAGAQNVTVPNLKLSGFSCEVFQSGAGQITTVGSGATVSGRSGLKTAGQYAKINIDQYNKTSYIVSGDTAV